MKSKIAIAVHNIVNAKYTQNTISSEEFERLFEQELIKQGYQSLDKSLAKPFKKMILASEEPIANTTGICGYIDQPFNTQSFPDFLIFEEKQIFPIECKSSNKNDIPVWNNSLPKQYAIYLMMAFSNKVNLRETLCFKGNDVITLDLQKELENELKLSQNSINEKQKTLRKLDIYEHGWTAYVRANYRQKILSELTVMSFTKHPNKQTNINKVINYLDSV